MSSEVAWDCPQCGMHNVAADAAAGDLCCKACGEPAPPLEPPCKPLTPEEAAPEGGTALETKRSPRKRGITPLAKSRKPLLPKEAAPEDSTALETKRSPRKRGITPLAKSRTAKSGPKSKPKPELKLKPQMPDADESQSPDGVVLPPPGFSWQCPECGSVHVIDDPASFDMCPACGYEVTPEDLVAYRVIPKPKPKPRPRPPRPAPPSPPPRPPRPVPPPSPPFSPPPPRPRPPRPETPPEPPSPPPEKEEKSCSEKVWGCLGTLFWWWLALQIFNWLLCICS